MHFLFGLSLPSGQPIDRELATLIAGRITTASTSLKQGASAAVTAQIRGDAQRYLDARRSGAIRFTPGAGRACDEGAWTLMRLTVDAPPVPTMAAQLVA